MQRGAAAECAAFLSMLLEHISRKADVVWVWKDEPSVSWDARFGTPPSAQQASPLLHRAGTAPIPPRIYEPKAPRNRGTPSKMPRSSSLPVLRNEEPRAAPRVYSPASRPLSPSTDSMSRVNVRVQYHASAPAPLPAQQRELLRWLNKRHETRTAIETERLLALAEGHAVPPRIYEHSTQPRTDAAPRAGTAPSSSKVALPHRQRWTFPFEVLGQPEKRDAECFESVARSAGGHATWMVMERQLLHRNSRW